MSHLIPGAHQVDDPGEEIERLARKRVPSHVALDEFRHVAIKDGYAVTAHIVVMVNEPWQPPAGLGARIANLVKTAWEAGCARD